MLLTGVTRLALVLVITLASMGLAALLLYLCPPLLLWSGLTITSCGAIGSLLIRACSLGVGVDRFSPWQRHVAAALFMVGLGGLLDYTMHRALGLRDFSTFLLLATVLPLVCVSSLLLVFAPSVPVEREGVIQLFPASGDSTDNPPEAEVDGNTRG